MLWLRLPFQAVLVAWVAWAARAGEGPRQVDGAARTRVLSRAWTCPREESIGPPGPGRERLALEAAVPGEAPPRRARDLALEGLRGVCACLSSTGT